MTPPTDAPSSIIRWPADDLRRRLADRRRSRVAGTAPPNVDPVDAGEIANAFSAALKQVALLLGRSGEVSRMSLTRFEPPIPLEDDWVRIGLLTFTDRSVPAGERTGWRILLRSVDRPVDLNQASMQVRLGDPVLVG